MTTPVLVFSKNNTLQCPAFRSPDFQSCNCQSPALNRSWAGYIHSPIHKRICLRFILMLSSDVIGGDMWNWYWTFRFYVKFEVTGLLPEDYYLGTIAWDYYLGTIAWGLLPWDYCLGTITLGLLLWDLLPWDYCLVTIILGLLPWGYYLGTNIWGLLPWDLYLGTNT